MDELTGSDLIAAGIIVSGFVAQFSRHYTKQRNIEMHELAMRLNNAGIRRPD